MTASTSSDRSVSDDALASGGPAGDGGFDPDRFDPDRPFTTRDRRQVKLHHRRRTGGWVGSVDGLGGYEWYSNGRFVAEGPYRESVNDLVNTPIPTVPLNPAGDMAGEDDAAFVELMARIDRPATGYELDRLVRVAREGARREPVTGDGWQPIKTAPKDGTKVLLYVVHAPDDYTAAVGEPEGWKHIDIGCFAGIGWEKLYSGDPTHWRPLPAAPGTHATTPATTPATSSEEALCRTLPFAASPDGAGSGSEPVAWQWPKPAPIDSTWDIDPVFLERVEHEARTEFWDEFSYQWENTQAVLLVAAKHFNAATPASVDAVAVVTEFQAAAAKCMTTSKVESSDWSFHSGAQNVCDLILAALRAHQQAPEARS